MIQPDSMPPWLKIWLSRNSSSFISLKECSVKINTLFSPISYEFNKSLYVGPMQEVMLRWIKRHTDISIYLDRSNRFNSAPTEIAILCDPIVNLDTHDILINQDNKLSLLDVSHHEKYSYSYILARNGLGDVDSYLSYLYSTHLQRKCVIDKAIIINTRWSSNNYYHWIHEALPRLKLLYDNVLDFADIPKIWGGPFPLLNYHYETLEKVGINPDKLIYLSGIIQIRKLINATMLHPGAFHPDQINYAKSFISSPAENSVSVQHFQNVLVLRSKQSNRYLDEPILIDRLQKEYGFKPIYFENYTVSEQADIMAHASCVIQSHGSGMTNIMHMRPGARIIELMPDDSIHPGCMYLAEQAKLRYSMCICKSTTARQVLKCCPTELFDHLRCS